MDKWQPIETAPVDEEILLFWSNEFPFDIGIWNGAHWQRANDGMEEYDAPPTFWMTLPGQPDIS